MTDSNAITGCPLCGASIGAGDHACPHCRATPQWQDYVRAIDFARSEFAAWQSTGIISAEQMESVRVRLDSMREQSSVAAKQESPFPPGSGLSSSTTCWRCSRAIGRSYLYCNRCGIPLGERADRLRYLDFVLNTVEKTGDSDLFQDLSDTQVRACTADLRAQVTSLRAELEVAQLSGDALHAAQRDANPANEPAAQSPKQNATTGVTPIFQSDESKRVERRSLLQILLDPRSIQWLLASGGGLLVVGLVIWLASLGVFKNPLIVAGCMGTGTLGLMAGGFSTIKFTRHGLAGRAITLLACLAMPLNLWFYHAHGLVTVEGHLWVAALICCVLYAAAATLLEDPVFVYVLTAGVAMTGLLILADLHSLMEVASPSALLVVLGLISLHAERAFIDGDGPFSRKRFGMAFFWSAQALLGAGLLLLLGAQVATQLTMHFGGWMPADASWLASTSSIIATNPGQRLLALALVVAGAYASIYSGLVVRRVNVYFYLAAAMLLWAEWLVIDLAHLTAEPSALIGMLALTSLIVNAIQSIASSRQTSAISPRVNQPLALPGLFLAALPVLMGMLLDLRVTQFNINHIWPYAMTRSYPAAMAFTALCCWVCVHLNEQRSSRIATSYLAATAAATLLAATGSLSLLGVQTWTAQSPILMVIPIASLLLSRLYQGRSSQRPLLTVAHAAAAVLVLAGLYTGFESVSPFDFMTGLHANLLPALFCAEAVLFYTAAALLYGNGINVYLATTMGCAMVCQLLGYWNIGGEYSNLIFAALGLLILSIDHVGAGKGMTRSPLSVAVLRSANLLISISLVSAALMANSRFAIGHTDWSLAIVLSLFTVLSLLSATLTTQAGIRRWYFTATVVQCLLTLFALEQQSQLNAWQHIELFSVAVGLLLLCTGYTLWYREQDRPIGGASMCLAFGALLATVPLAIAAVIYRFGYDISLPNEFALATVSILMFVTGFMFRLRAPTLVGGSFLAIHLAVLSVSVGMRAQLAVDIYLAIGGAVLFGLGILLSLYRDRLLSLPRRIKEHEGVFQVLAWR